MRLLRIEKSENGKPVVVVEESRTSGFWWWEKEVKKETKYLVSGERVRGFWKWLKLPDLILVGDSMSFQLNAWYRESFEFEHIERKINE